jgi:hypothetical protein
MLDKIIEIIKLPKIKVEIINNNSDAEILKIYKYFTKPHSKIPFIRNKTIGVMLYQLPQNIEEYEKKIAGKNGVSYFSRRCKKNGYYTKYFNQPDYLKQLYNINTSAEFRQGSKMSEHYLSEVQPEKDNNFSKWYGVFDINNVLVRIY